MTLRFNSFIFILSILYSAPLKDVEISEFIEQTLNEMGIKAQNTGMKKPASEEGLKILKEMVEKILSRLDYHNINEIPPFDKENPSAENIARWLFLELKTQIDTESTRIKRVEIYEMEGCGASYFE